MRRGSGKKWLVLVGALAVVAATVTGVAIYSSSPPGFSASGSVSLHQVEDKTCTASYSGIASGVQVTVRDQTDQIIGVSGLGSPRVSIDNTTSEGVLVGATICEFPFKVRVPAGKSFYTLTIGNRPSMVIPEDKMRQPINLVPRTER